MFLATLNQVVITIIYYQPVGKTFHLCKRKYYEVAELLLEDYLAQKITSLVLARVLGSSGKSLHSLIVCGGWSRHWAGWGAWYTGIQEERSLCGWGGRRRYFLFSVI